MPFQLPELRKPTSVWELKQVIELIDERCKELLRHRGEVATGDYLWDNKEAKAEFFRRSKKRSAIRKKIIDGTLDL